MLKSFRTGDWPGPRFQGWLADPEASPCLEAGNLINMAALKCHQKGLRKLFEQFVYE